MAKNIMIVDDSKSIRQTLSFTLSEAGYEVCEAVDGADALKVIEGKSIDMVFTDLNMPNMNGLDLIRSLRGNADYRYMPIVMLTTESDGGIKQEGKEAGATAWIVKPFKPAQLLAVAKKILGG